MKKSASLTPLQKDIILNKHTEYPYTGEYTDNEINGSYLCRNCGIALFRATNKFQSTCGWPSFELAIKNVILEKQDSDGNRTEIICARCCGHLGHVFRGENLTPTNTRYCVNSASLDFVMNTQIVDTEEIILAGGCFWGIEYNIKKQNGIILTQVGYCGGTKNNPSYKEVCTNTTGHLEVVRVIFDNAKLSLDNLLKYFFKIHNATQANGQGLDIGNQYLSAIFCYNEKQKDIATKVIQSLPNSQQIVTTVNSMSTFWVGEQYHQDYYNKKGIEPYCNIL